MSSHLRDAALFYRKRGWSVIPVSPVTKKALVKWQEYSERVAAVEEIEQWWRNFPNAGVGVVTGKVSNLIVLDVDTKKGADANHVYRTFPTDLVVRTGSGGGHFYYQYPSSSDHIPNVVGKKDGHPTGYDLRADGGYVVAPPSLHPSGRRYEWITTGKRPADATPQLLKFILPKTELNGGTTSTEPWLADALQGVGEGARDDTCARLAGYFLSKGLPEDVVIEQLRLWNERNDQSGTEFTDADILKTVKSVQRTRARRPMGPKSQPEGRNLEDGPEDLLRLMSLQQYMTDYGAQEVSWAVKDWLPDETIAMIVSPPGTYKTWTLIDLAVSIATGTPFLGIAPVERRGPVLIFQQEDFHGQMAQRIAAVMQSRFLMGWDGDVTTDEIGLTLPPNPPIYLHDNRELRFDNPEVMDVLDARIDELRPVLVIGDPLYTMAPMDDYMAKAIPFMMRLKRMRDQYHTSFMLAHHTSKRAEKSTREDLWGSQFLNAFLETGWQVRPKSETQAVIRRHFKVSKDIAESVLTFDIDTTGYPYKYRASLAAKKDADEHDNLLLLALEQQSPLSIGEMAKMVGLSKSSVYRQVRMLVATGRIRLGMDDRYRLPGDRD
jgi:hypothetical protein